MRRDGKSITTMVRLAMLTLAAILGGCGPMVPDAEEPQSAYRMEINCSPSSCHAAARDTCYRHHGTERYDVVGQAAGRGIVVDCRP